jgi:hypothetical protein
MNCRNAIATVVMAPRASSAKWASPTWSLVALLVLLAGPAGAGEADDAHVWAALQEGGKVVLMRHAHVIIKEGIGRLSPGHCEEEVNLSALGIEQAKRIGAAFRAHGVAVGEVLSSPYCRSLDTGQLAFGRARPVDYLLPTGVVSEQQAAANDNRVTREIVQYRGSTNLVLITQDMNIANIVLEPAEMGEMFVLQPVGADFVVVGEIRIEVR